MPDPEKKVFDIALFSASLLDYLGLQNVTMGGIE